MNIKSCATCALAKTASISGAVEWQGFCHFDPPTPALIMIPGKLDLATGQPTQQASLQAIRPPVTAGDFCSHYEKKEIANDKPTESFTPTRL